MPTIGKVESNRIRLLIRKFVSETGIRADLFAIAGPGRHFSEDARTIFVSPRDSLMSCVFLFRRHYLCLLIHDGGDPVILETLGAFQPRSGSGIQQEERRRHRIFCVLRTSLVLGLRLAPAELVPASEPGRSLRRR